MIFGGEAVMLSDTERKREKFLWWPIKLVTGRTVWLETVWVTEERVYNCLYNCWESKWIIKSVQRKINKR